MCCTCHVAGSAAGPSVGGQDGEVSLEALVGDGPGVAGVDLEGEGGPVPDVLLHAGDALDMVQNDDDVGRLARGKRPDCDVAGPVVSGQDGEVCLEALVGDGLGVASPDLEGDGAPVPDVLLHAGGVHDIADEMVMFCSVGSTFCNPGWPSFDFVRVSALDCFVCV